MTSGTDAKQYLEKFKNAGAKMKQEVPETTSGFATLFSKIMQDGALTLKEKEFIALGIGVALQCEPCIRIHTKKCLDVGATKEQILEAASVAVMMAGGPAYTHIPMVMETIEALQA